MVELIVNGLGGSRSGSSLVDELGLSRGVENDSTGPLVFLLLQLLLFLLQSQSLLLLSDLQLPISLPEGSTSNWDIIRNTLEDGTTCGEFPGSSETYIYHSTLNGRRLRKARSPHGSRKRLSSSE